jgi:hypothetical protein
MQAGKLSFATQDRLIRAGHSDAKNFAKNVPSWARLASELLFREAVPLRPARPKIAIQLNSLPAAELKVRSLP